MFLGGDLDIETVSAVAAIIRIGILEEEVVLVLGIGMPMELPSEGETNGPIYSIVKLLELQHVQLDNNVILRQEQIMQ